MNTLVAAQPRISVAEASQRFRNCGFTTERDYYGSKLNVRPRKGSERWQFDIADKPGSSFGLPVQTDTVDENEIMLLVRRSHTINP